MKKILVTSIGSVAGDIVIKNLRKEQHYIVGCDIYPKEWIVDAYNVDTFYSAPYVSEADKYLDFIKKICIKEEINYIFPLIDYEIDVLNANRTWFIENNICICISPKETIDLIRNKKNLADFLEVNVQEINSIPTMMLRDIKNYPKWDFPVVCKPFNGRSSQGLEYIHTNEEWNKFIEKADKNVYIVQPFIEGYNVMVEIVRSTDNKVIAITRKGGLLSTANGCGLVVYMYQDKVLEERCMKVAEKLGVVGCVNFEFLCDGDKYHFVECNPRFSAGCEFSCMAGYDCIINHLRCFTNAKIDDYTFKHNQYIARKYEEYVTKIEE